VDIAELERHLEDFILANGCLHILAPFVLDMGKRIRATLFFSFGDRIVATEMKYKTVSIIEAIHFASILHDDVVDNCVRRRAGESFFSKHGPKASILLGDLIIIRAMDEFLKLHAADNLVKNMFIRECRSTAYGAALERQMTANSALHEYVRTAALKTGALFKLSCFLGSYLGTKDFALAKCAATFGLCFGIVYQAQNDIDCYRFEKFEESEDYMQKNISFPIIILRDHFGFNMRELSKPSQGAYDKIRDTVFSDRFRQTAQISLRKYTATLSY
jgi:geranylgeranyl pyrophosphate synthase